jgi:hypothetical protein
LATSFFDYQSSVGAGESRVDPIACSAQSIRSRSTWKCRVIVPDILDRIAFRTALRRRVNGVLVRRQRRSCGLLHAADVINPSAAAAESDSSARDRAADQEPARVAEAAAALVALAAGSTWCSSRTGDEDERTRGNRDALISVHPLTTRHALILRRR